MKRLKRSIATLLAIALVIAQMADLGQWQAEAAKAPKLSKTKLTLRVGQKKTLSVKNKKKGMKYKWTSTNKKVATVSKKRVVTAKRVGKASIKCVIRRNNKKVKTLVCKVVVKAAKKVEESKAPVTSPSTAPSVAPSVAPSTAPSVAPSVTPVVSPSVTPVVSPSVAPADAAAFVFEETAVKAYDAEGDLIENCSAISNTTVTIQKPGEYAFSGTCSSGQIFVNVDKDDFPKSEEIDNTVTLSLEGLTLSNENNSPIYVKCIDDEVAISAKKKTENTLSDGTSYTNADGKMGCIYAKDDIKFKGKGTLNVNGNGEDGIVCKNDIKIYNGTINVIAKDDAIRGNDSITIGDEDDLGTDGAYDSLALTVTSREGKGLYTKNYEDEDKGYVEINGGIVEITAYGDGIRTEQEYIQNGGEVTIATTCDADPAALEATMNAKGVHVMLDSETVLTDMPKALVNDGTLNISCNDSAMYVNGEVAISGGAVELLSETGYGIFAESSVTVSGKSGLEEAATLAIKQSVTGIYGSSVDLRSGNTSIYADNKGIEASSIPSALSGATGFENLVEAIPDSVTNTNSTEHTIRTTKDYLFVTAGQQGLLAENNIQIGGRCIVYKTGEDENKALSDSVQYDTNSRVIILTVGTDEQIGRDGFVSMLNQSYGSNLILYGKDVESNYLLFELEIPDDFADTTFSVHVKEKVDGEDQRIELGRTNSYSDSL